MKAPVFGTENRRLIARPVAWPTAAHHWNGAQHFKARRLRVHEEQRRTLTRRNVRVCDSRDDGERGAQRTGREPLAAVDHPAVAALHRSRLKHGRVGTGAGRRFGHGEAGSTLASGERFEIVFLLPRRRRAMKKVHVALIRRGTM